MTQKEKFLLMVEALNETKSLYLKALQEGISYVKYRWENEIACPLCEASKKINKDSFLDYCIYCPWVVIRGNTCLDVKEAMTRISYNSEVIMTRVSQIDNWILIYKGMLYELKQGVINEN